MVGSTAEVASSSSSRPGPAHEGAGEGDALALAARQRGAPLPDDRLVAAGEGADEPLGPGEGEGRVAAARPASPSRTFSAHRVGEQERLLEGRGDRGAQLARPTRSASVAAVEADRRRESGSSRPATSSSSVDLPEPVAPTTATVRPGSTVKETSSSDRHAGLVGEA